jgi:hypothetical protein
MIWHNAQKPSRGTRWFIVAVLLFTLVMLYGATRISPVGASAPHYGQSELTTRDVPTLSAHLGLAVPGGRVR